MSKRMNDNADEEPAGSTAGHAGTDRDKTRKLPFWRAVLSVIQASFGVQSAKNRRRDFSQGSVSAFITAALIFTTVFVLALILVVRLVLSG